uniref:14-3-3 domain-containing protein n=1 Tax=Ciona savignyi TaxID=51511 RepID=H2ZFT1_CIOSA
MAAQYKKEIELELKSVCNEVTDLINTVFLVKCETECDLESKVFYLKMKGDYKRYIAEVVKEDIEKEAVTSASDAAYTEALVAAENLPPRHPIRLGLSLNYSVFQYEILQNESTACEIAKKAFDNAIDELNNLHGKDYDDSVLIVQLLRDNLTLWSQEYRHLMET